MITYETLKGIILSKGIECSKTFELHTSTVEDIICGYPNINDKGKIEIHADYHVLRYDMENGSIELYDAFGSYGGSGQQPWVRLEVDEQGCMTCPKDVCIFENEDDKIAFLKTYQTEHRDEIIRELKERIHEHRCDIKYSKQRLRETVKESRQQIHHAKRRIQYYNKALDKYLKSTDDTK